MILSLLVGNLLMVAVATANPMYSQAVLQRPEVLIGTHPEICYGIHFPAIGTNAPVVPVDMETIRVTCNFHMAGIRHFRQFLPCAVGGRTF